MNLIKKCPRCGAILTGTTRFCGKCGCDTEERPANDYTPRPVETARTFPDRGREQKPLFPEEDRMPSDKRGDPLFSDGFWKIAAVVAAAVIVLVVAIVLVIRVNTRPKAEDVPELTVSATAEPMHVVAAGDGVAAPAPATATPRPTLTPAPATAAPTPTGPAVNDASGIAYTLADNVNIYAGPGREYQVIGTAMKGAELARTGVTDGWTRIEYNGREGFIANSDITLTQPTPTPSPTPVPGDFAVTPLSDTVVVTGSTANLRRGPGLDFEVATNVPAGTELSRTGTYDGWSQVSYNGEKLYISETLIEAKASAAPTPAPAAENTPAPAAQTVTLAMNANVRSGPGTDYGILGLAEGGSSLPSSGREGDWYKVTFNGQTGYVFAELVE